MCYSLTPITPPSVQEHRSWLHDTHQCQVFALEVKTQGQIEIRIKFCYFLKFCWSSKYLSIILMIIAWQVHFHHITTEISIRCVFRMLANWLSKFTFTLFLFKLKVQAQRTYSDGEYSRYIVSLLTPTSVLSKLSQRTNITLFSTHFTTLGRLGRGSNWDRLQSGRITSLLLVPFGQ